MLSRSNPNTSHPQNLNGDQLFHLNALKASYQVDKVPSDYNEAISSPNHAMWKAAMDKELASLKLHGTYKLVDPPHNVKILGDRWVFHLNLSQMARPLQSHAGSPKASCRITGRTIRILSPP